jgi:hypothetical protein
VQRILTKLLDINLILDWDKGFQHPGKGDMAEENDKK